MINNLSYFLNILQLSHIVFEKNLLIDRFATIYIELNVIARTCAILWNGSSRVDGYPNW